MKAYEDEEQSPLSPHMIEVLLWCHCNPEPKEEASSGWMQTIYDFERAGVLEKERDGNRYRTTNLGAAWVNALCHVAMPRKVFIDESNRIL